MTRCRNLMTSAKSGKPVEKLHVEAGEVFASRLQAKGIKAVHLDPVRNKSEQLGRAGRSS